MSVTNRKSGFSIVEIILAAVIVGIMVLLGLTLSKTLDLSQNALNTSQTQSPTVSDNEIPSTPETIDNTDDLDTSASILDEINLDDDSGDSSTLDAQLDNF